jgi:hypothetical protein
MDVAYRRPDPYFAIPEGERPERIYETDDICVIDETQHFVRGVLEAPISDTEDRFAWGVWALVDRHDFNDYVTAWVNKTEDDMPSFGGKVPGGIATCPDSDLIEVTVRPRSGGLRPTFTVCSADHPLGIAQRTGISIEIAHNWVRPFVDKRPAPASWLKRLGALIWRPGRCSHTSPN